MDTVNVSGRRGVSAKRSRVATKNKPGRPEGSSNVRDEILDAAELLFADLGYAGTTLREIADAAQVTQALINYYFGSKYGLFEEVFLRRGRKISDERLSRLAELKRAGSLQVSAIVHAFLTPTLALRSTKAGRAFIRLQARLHTEPPEISYKLRNEAYDVSTKAYVEAFRVALPYITECEAYWRVTLMVGAYMYAFSDTHRLEQLAGNVCHPDDSQEVLEQMVAFVTAGMEAPSRQKVY
ncbi:TetR family transcriptional regulator [Pseudomonas duriflava]|uniref:TetR family transcriptional regulator n=1 Tax=Pseudomonas duriflava TaxID=459528 RepID=A0A562QJ48_9PSED|nr:TetR/AcrR family transcriptional regulator [Pseudomonas duriflava]TWI56761.1 TetR family transcriptional regulator [Pseudomonas duriflava]